MSIFEHYHSPTECAIEDTCVVFLYYYVSYLSTLKLLDIRVHLTLFSVVGDALLMMVFTSIESPMLGSWPEQRR